MSEQAKEYPMRGPVYVAGPLTKGGETQNVRNAMAAAERLLWYDIAPIVPHLTVFWDLMYHHSYETWMAMDFAHILACVALLRIPGESAGADREVTFANLHGIPVFYEIKELVTWMDQNFKYELPKEQ